MAAKASNSIARRWRIGRAAPPSCFVPCMSGCSRSLKASVKLFADETAAPVLDPGRGTTKTGQLWAYARDDRPWGGPEPPAVAYVYEPDRNARAARRASRRLSGGSRSTATAPTRRWPSEAR